MILFSDPSISGAALVGSQLQFTRGGVLESHNLVEINPRQGGTASGASLNCNAVSVIFTISGTDYNAVMCLKTFQDMKYLAAYQPGQSGALQRIARKTRDIVHAVTNCQGCGGK